MPLPLSTVVTEHAVIARYRLTGDGYGDPSERAAVLKAQAILAEAVERAGVGEFDGNEFGAGEAVPYAYGPDADALFDVMAPMLRSLPFRPARVLLRYGSAYTTSGAERLVDLQGFALWWPVPSSRTCGTDGAYQTYLVRPVSYPQSVSLRVRPGAVHGTCTGRTLGVMLFACRTRALGPVCSRSSTPWSRPGTRIGYIRTPAGLST